MKSPWVKLGAVLGVVYCIAGFVLVFLGWNGAASNDTATAQFPYLISGGIAGLALVVVGAALLISQSLRRDRVELRGAIEDLRTAVDHLSGATARPAPTPAVRPSPAEVTAEGDEVTGTA